MAGIRKIDKGNVWFSSDHHFCHYNVIKFEKRPFQDTLEMNQEMVARWNSVVGPEDTIYYLGDFCLSNKKKIMEFKKKMNGKHWILIKGNHDRSAKSMMECGFDEVYKQLRLELAPDVDVLLCHYPYRPKNDITKDSLADLPEFKIKHFNDRPVDDGGWLIHGHTHSRWSIKDHMINVSVENWDYKPVHFRDILKIIKGT